MNARKLPDGADAVAGARVDQAHEIVVSECDVKREAFERQVIDEGSREPEWNVDRNRPSGRTLRVGGVWKDKRTKESEPRGRRKLW